MDIESQIFIQFEPDTEEVEYLLDEQPVHMIRGKFITKDEVRQVIATGSTYRDGEYMKLSQVPNLMIGINTIVTLDSVLRIITKVEQHIF